jgi:hypothetical protein
MPLLDECVPNVRAQESLRDGSTAQARCKSPRHARAAHDGRTPVRNDQGADGATHFLLKRLPRVATEMALHVLAYNLTRVLNIVGIKPMMAAVRA